MQQKGDDDYNDDDDGRRCKYPKGSLKKGLKPQSSWPKHIARTSKALKNRWAGHTEREREARRGGVKSGKLKTVGGDSTLATSCERALVMGLYHEIYHPVTVLDSSKRRTCLHFMWIPPSIHDPSMIHPSLVKALRGRAECGPESSKAQGARLSPNKGIVGRSWGWAWM
jgi:hypothetical protein